MTTAREHHGGMATGMDAFGPAGEFTVGDLERTPELHVVIPPFEWRGSARTALQPDVLVVRRGDLLAVDGG